MRQFEGKVVAITGASSGIGRAAALAFAAEGARVALGARRAAECQKIVRLIEERGGEACFAETDVTRADQVERLIRSAVDRWGRLDCALNNAGIEGEAFIPTAEYSEEMWNRVMDTNLRGVFLAMKYEIPQMLERGGAIVNMSSVAGQIGGSAGIAYHASKHGVIGATKAAAMEYAARGIRVNAVCPAIIETEMARRLFGEKLDNLRKAHPLGRFGTPEEVADAVLWLCSERASFVTGIALPVDGGFLAR
jgi:NAD(P)-dependent dehydrogenase (short-subunit alcohol dehydrogenase family)